MTAIVPDGITTEGHAVAFACFKCTTEREAVVSVIFELPGDKLLADAKL